MSADTLLSRLDGVRSTGKMRWIAKCPAHSDRSPSLSIREIGDGRVLVFDHAGCSIEDVLGAVNLDFDSLFPVKPLADHNPREHRPFLPADIFEIARREVGVVAIIAADLHKAREVAESDYARIFVAVKRLNNIAGAAYGR